jgi:hypothetical protein
MNLANYWAQYGATLERVRTEKPHTLLELKAILDSFEPPSSGVAFFPGGADDTLADALSDAGWAIHYIEADYLWEARSPTSQYIHHVEGDLYDGDHDGSNRTEQP